MTTIKTDGSVYGAFAVLRDGKWHSRQELQERCGASGDRRARELRDEQWGGWALRQAYGRGLVTPEERGQVVGQFNADMRYYRIMPDELQTKVLIAVMLDNREPPELRLRTKSKTSVDDYTDGDLNHNCQISLTYRQIAYLLGKLQHHTALDAPGLAEAWEPVRVVIINRLRSKLPDAVVGELPDLLRRPPQT